MSADFTPSLSNYQELRPFRFWCQKVLPLVYDDSLSYYEVLCKLKEKLNELIQNDGLLKEEILNIQNNIKIIDEWIKNFDYSIIEKLIREYIATMIFVEINDSGYIVYNIPEAWRDITFNTTELDIEIPGYSYGHLVLSY